MCWMPKQLDLNEHLNNSIGMNFVLIHAGQFTMGSPENELGRNKDETQHEVILTTDISNRLFQQKKMPKLLFING